MKKVLIISFYFPPCGSSSTARNLGLAKHLKGLGFEPTVLTVKEETFEKLPTIRKDDSYSGDLADLNIVRTSSFIPVWLIKLLYRLRLSRLMRIFFPLEFHIFWLVPGLLRSLSIIKREKPDLIISTSLPNTPHLIALFANKIMKTPWIADFQDPMGYRFGDVWFTKLTHKLILFLEKLILKNASGVTTQSKTAADILLERYTFLKNEKITHITNAFDTEISSPVKTPKRANKFRIVHSGEFYADYPSLRSAGKKLIRILLAPLKWTEYVHFKADLMPHSALLLLKTLKALLESDPGLNDRLEVVLNGYLNPIDINQIKAMGLEKTIKLTGMTGYAESLKIINSADLLYLPLFWDINRERNYCIPGKVFPYIASLNPIFAPIQEGDTKDIVLKSGLGIFPSPYRLDEMAENLRVIIRSHFDGDSFMKPDLEFIKQFSRASQVKNMYDFAERIIL